MNSCPELVIEKWDSCPFNESIENLPLSFPKNNSTPSFEVNSFLNSKIILSNSKPFYLLNNVKSLNIDALLLQIPKKHLQTKPSEYRANILKYCDNTINSELKQEQVIPLGDYIITHNHGLPKIKYIIHSVLPKYSEQYSNASLSSLHLSMRNCIDACVQNKIKSFIFGKDFFSPSQNFPLNNSIEVIIRTLRKCLEIVYKYFDYIIISVDDISILEKVGFYLKVYFPRNEDEINKYKQYIPNNKQTKYGDLIYEERTILISKHIKEKNDNSNNNIYFVNNDLENFTFDEMNYISDAQRINEVFNQETDYMKKFYYENKGLYSNEIESLFEKMNFLNFKGTDMYKRQIYFVYLRLLDFEQIEKYNLENLDIKLNYQENKKFSLIIFCNSIDKKNYPTVSITENINKIIMSLSTLSFFNINELEICLFLPNFFFKVYFQFLKMYISNQLLDRVVIYESYNEINENYCLGLDEEVETRITNTLLRNKDIYTQISEEKENVNNLIQKKTKVKKMQNNHS